MQCSPVENRSAHILEGLTEPQKQAVLTTEGPLLVIAAAGSGKTRVITRRIAYLIYQGIPPWQILALTFTNKAAAEMAQRVHALLEQDHLNLRGLTVATFHSLCARILRRYADRLEIPGLNSAYSIYDTADQKALLKQVLERLDISRTNFPPRSVLSSISNFKNQLTDPTAALAAASGFYHTQVARIYGLYNQALRSNNAVDFDDLLMLTAELLHRCPEVTAELQDRFNYLLIDEYQDTNYAQFRIASLLAERNRNICVVGDPDQSIYGWRGADISNILDFEERYNDAAVIALGQNFRSTQYILKAADTLIRNNQLRRHKDLFTTTDGGERPQVILCDDEHHEAKVVLDFFRDRIDRHNLTWRDCAVFYRVNSLSRVMEDALRRDGVPYIIARGTAFYQRQEIKDAMAYLKLISNVHDSVSLTRIINLPPRGIGKTTLEYLSGYAARERISLYDTLLNADKVTQLSKRAMNSVRQFADLLQDWQLRCTAEVPLAEGESVFVVDQFTEFVRDIIARSGLEDYYRKRSGNEEDMQRIENLAELVSSAADFASDWFNASLEVTDTDSDTPAENLATAVSGTRSISGNTTLLDLLRAFLEQISLVADVDNLDSSAGAVSLMTLHAAKGLEFPVVAMIGLEERLLPHSMSAESDAQLEEERRLCFVGMTRAREHLLLTCARKRTIRGVTEGTYASRFLSELPRDAVLFSDQSESFSPPRPAHHEVKLQQDQPRPLNNSSSVQFPKGCMIRHPRFGIGKVIANLPGGLIKITFADVGTKTLSLKYVTLQRVE